MKTNGNALLSNFMDWLPDAICVVDKGGHFVSVSGACERIFGYTPEEMTGKLMIDLVFHEDRERTLQAAQKIMGGFLQLHFENRYVRKDGRIVHIMWSARWSEVDQIRVAVARDITGRKTGELVHAAHHTIPNVAPRWHLSASPPRLVPRLCADSPVCPGLHDIAGAGHRRLDTQMRRLRRKVEQACGLQLPVTTLRGVGFHFYDDIEVCR